jgi:hypothetical protein
VFSDFTELQVSAASIVLDVARTGCAYRWQDPNSTATAAQPQCLVSVQHQAQCLQQKPSMTVKPVFDHFGQPFGIALPGLLAVVLPGWLKHEPLLQWHCIAGCRTSPPCATVNQIGLCSVRFLIGSHGKGLGQRRSEMHACCLLIFDACCCW